MMKQKQKKQKVTVAKLIVFSEDNMPPAMSQIIARWDIRGTTIKKADTVLCLGEIANMEGHIAFVDIDGKVWWGYHPDNFRQYDEEVD